MTSSFIKHIVIDVRTVVTNQSHGIARHTAELVEHLIENQPQDMQFTLLVHKNSPYKNYILPKNFFLREMRWGWLTPWGQFELALVLRSLKPDLFHSPSFVVSVFSSTPFVATIHDLIHVKMSNEYTFFHQLYYRHILSRKIRKAKAVVTVSEFSKHELVDYFGIDSRKVHVIYNGISSNFVRREGLCVKEKEEFRQRYELPDKFILSVGNKKSHKNIPRLVEAWCKGNFSEDLVLLTEFDPVLLKIAGQYNRRHRIFFIRFVVDKDLPVLYSLAKIFVYPSLYEGFGLPPLEAAACGIPVVVSEVSSLPEVMHDAAIFIDPTDTNDIVRGMREALENKDSCVTRNVSKGYAVANSYSWKQMAAASVDLYREICQS